MSKFIELHEINGEPFIFNSDRIHHIRIDKDGENSNAHIVLDDYYEFMSLESYNDVKKMLGISNKEDNNKKESLFKPLKMVIEEWG